MQTERVTYLTSAEQKAALEAFAKERGESVGNVLREATARYLDSSFDEEAELASLVKQVNDALPVMQASLDEMRDTLRATNERVERTLREAGFRK